MAELERSGAPAAVETVVAGADGGLGVELRRRNPLPEGALVLAVALGVQGLAAYGFLVISSRALGPVAYSPLSALWALAFVAAPGLFLPLEQEVGRALAARRATGIGGRPVVVRAALLGAVLVVAVIAAAGAAFGPLVDRLFDGQAMLLLGFAVAVASYSMYYLARGVLAGSGRFGAYGLVMVVEGAARVGAAGALWLLGVRSPGAYSLAIGLPCLVGLLAVLPAQRNLTSPGPRAPWRELSAALGWLLTGSVLAQLLINIGPLAVKSLFSGGDPAAAGRFLNGLIVARIPLFFFQAVQASLMPKLAAAAAAGRMAEFRDTLRRLLLLVAAVVVVSVAGMVALGPPVVRLMFGAGFDLSRLDLALLAFGSELMMAALTLSYSCIALGGYGRAAIGWAGGIAGVAVVAALVPGSVGRVELAFCGGVVAAVAVMAIGLRGLMRARQAG